MGRNIPEARAESSNFLIAVSAAAPAMTSKLRLHVSSPEALATRLLQAEQ